MKASTTGVKLPIGYESKLTLLETEVAIKQIKDFFQQELSKALDLTRVSAPLFVRPETGLNDNLNGVERPVSFDIMHTKEEIEILQLVLAGYGLFSIGMGIYYLQKDKNEKT